MRPSITAKRSASAVRRESRRGFAFRSRKKIEANPEKGEPEQIETAACSD
jgi:hypothetical protein